MKNRREETIQDTAGSLAGQRGQLCLYIAGKTPRSERAQANLLRCCEKYFRGCYELDIIDLLEHPGLGKRDHILALPLLVRRHPSPQHHLVGDLSDAVRLRHYLAFSATD